MTHALSVAIIARDEARHIKACLDSLSGLATEVVVLVDNRTSDTTASLCAAHGARVFIEPWRGFPGQRNRALDLCRYPWVLFIDADERVEPNLASEIRALLAAMPLAVGYWILRHNRFFGQTLRGDGWYPDCQLRLLRRDVARYDEARLIHEFADLHGELATLRGHFTHENIETLAEFWAKQTSYALAQARTMAMEGRHVRLRNFFGAPAREFVRRYIQLGGWRDGALGFFLCGALAWFELVAYAFLLHIQAKK